MLAPSLSLVPAVAPAAVAPVAVTETPGFHALVTEHRPSLVARAKQLCRSHMDPEDLVQDTLERAFRGYHTLRDGARARAWLFTILSNTFIDRIRQKNSEPPSDPLDEVAVAAPPPSPRPAWERITEAQLSAAVATLPEELRELYRLHAIEGLDYNQLSTRLGLNKNTVGTRLLRARKLLREALAGAAGEAVQP